MLELFSLLKKEGFKRSFVSSRNFTDFPLETNRTELPKAGAETAIEGHEWVSHFTADVAPIFHAQFDGTAGDFGLEVDWIRFHPA